MTRSERENGDKPRTTSVPEPSSQHSRRTRKRNRPQRACERGEVDSMTMDQLTDARITGQPRALRIQRKRKGSHQGSGTPPQAGIPMRRGMDRDRCAWVGPYTSL